MRKSVVTAIVAVCLFVPAAQAETVTLRPDATDALYGSVTGPSAHAALADDSDSTYVTLPPPAPFAPSGVAVHMRDLTVPPGYRFDGVRIRVRVAAVSVSTPAYLFTWLPIPIGGSGPSITARVDWLQPTTLSTINLFHYGKTVEELNRSLFNVSLDPGTGSGALRVYEAYVDASYAANPGTVSRSARVTRRS